MNLENNPEFTRVALRNASATVRRLNPGLFVGQLRAQESEQKARRALERGQAGPGQSASRLGSNGPILRVTLIRFCAREFDSDNLAGGYKPLRDAIAAWLGLNDSDRVIAWEYDQHQTNGREGTAVTIERL